MPILTSRFFSSFCIIAVALILTVLLTLSLELYLFKELLLSVRLMLLLQSDILLLMPESKKFYIVISELDVLKNSSRF